jgi:hypothetical protein
MENGVVRGSAKSSGATRAWAKDALGAIALAEGAICDRVFSALGQDLVLPQTNAFGTPVEAESAKPAAIETLVAAADKACSEGKRATLVASAGSLAAASAGLKSIRARRLGLVVHALIDGETDAYALADLGWGVLVASSVEDSLDLSLIARRAAEDSGTPFFVVHERSTVRHKEPLFPVDVELCEVYIGASSSRVRNVNDPAHPKHANVNERAFAERVPFALGSAMRELERLTGRHHDMLERIPVASSGGSDGAVVMVGIGGLGESLLGVAERLRFGGADVAAVKLVSVRPFPGARLVKSLSRALAVSVLEAQDRPLSQSNALTSEIKAAFADALTWAPEYPGIGRIPRIISGVCDMARVESSDFDRVVYNMFADERGQRFFVLGRDALTEATADHVPASALTKKNGAAQPAAEPDFRMRVRTSDLEAAETCAELSLAVLSSVLGLRARAAVRELPLVEGGGFACDVLASRSRPRDAHAPEALQLLVLDDTRALIEGNPLARLARGGVLAVPSPAGSPDQVWAGVPPYVKAIVFDRAARVVGFAPDAPAQGGAAARWRTAAAFAGVTVAVAASFGARGEKVPAVDGSLVAREVAEIVLAAAGRDQESLAKGAGDLARRSFEAHVEVPRGVVERDEEAIHLGRKDARAAVTPR